MASIALDRIAKVFTRPDGSPTRVLDELTLQVAAGEFLTLLGPSGCGKSTLIRIIAGLEPQSAGSVSIGGQCVDGRHPRQRDVAMVFQSYALYPHMTVEANLALPLVMRRLTALQRAPWIGRWMPGYRRVRETIDRDVREVAGALELTHLLERKPGQLSGGQRQRVALARAMVRQPSVFLMDEPLSNLDAKLRTQMRAEITALHRRLRTTFVYVTHDQTEAMTMSDRVAVMFDGRIEQIGPPTELYARPATRRVAEFIGTPQINSIDGIVRSASTIEVAGAVLPIGTCLPTGSVVTVGLRPESLTPVERAGATVLLGRVQRIEHMGADSYVYFHVLGQARALVLRTSAARAAGLQPEMVFHVATSLDQVLLFDSQGRAIDSVVPQIASVRSFR
ncbi:ABC transporter ATP-binding protein [Steroidobacter sp. S1-65]|uniref:ABC transporter ATP-binding protein n=1 Tax=Steroidobacter gossypii TaxID=2805490 RepID=A0ABS1WY94_9GAMM|nr:ABC transporter ATP-binding protein [Steroidobacter gossypii]MBM0105950.1 ABC transporter ATP-binding protein [Steroidobacter gossypii]